LAGLVVAVNHDRLPYGNMVLIATSFDLLDSPIIRNLEIEADESLYHLYAHFDAPSELKVGQWIECGQFLGAVGKTGYNIVVPHLHLETRIGPANAQFQDMAYYDTRATEDEMAKYELWRMSGMFLHFDPIKLFTGD